MLISKHTRKNHKYYAQRLQWMFVLSDLISLAELNRSNSVSFTYIKKGYYLFSDIVADH